MRLSQEASADFHASMSLGRVESAKDSERRECVFEICALCRILLLECAAEFCISAEKCLCMAGCEKGSTYGVLDIF